MRPGQLPRSEGLVLPEWGCGGGDPGPGGPTLGRAAAGTNQLRTQSKVCKKVGGRQMVHNSTSLFVLVGDHSDGWKKGGKVSVMGITRSFSEK